MYKVTSKWCGFFGGWGSESDIAAHMEAAAQTGYRLVRTESQRAWWYWCLPRNKMLFIYERVA